MAEIKSIGIKKNILDEYLSLTAQIKALETRLDELKPAIMAHLDECPECKTTYSGFNIAIQERKSWEYSLDVKVREKELKALKLGEEARGVAVLKSISRYPVARQAKKETASTAIETVSICEALPF